MLRHVSTQCLFVSAGVLVWGLGARAEVVIETVPVGNPGNANDTHGDGYGGVGYVYSIGKFEVTAGQYTAFLNAVAAEDSYGLYNPIMDSDSLGCQITQHGSSGSYTYDFSGGTVEAPGSTAADWENRPVNYVSWGDATRFANWLHNGQPSGAQDVNTTEDGSYYLNGATTDGELLAVVREDDATWVIPSEDEWYKAAYYDGGSGVYYDYPTSSDSVPSNDLIAPDPGNNATFYEYGYTIGSPYYRTEFGVHEHSESPYGTFDQGGNVWEWNEAVISGSFRGLRGGSFLDNDTILHAANRYNHAPTFESDLPGFRVAEVPDCNDNGIFDECDLHCGDTGRRCDVEGCGQSSDCNANDVPDECEIAKGYVFAADLPGLVGSYGGHAGPYGRGSEYVFDHQFAIVRKAWMRVRATIYPFGDLSWLKGCLDDVCMEGWHPVFSDVESCVPLMHSDAALDGVGAVWVKVLPPCCDYITSITDATLWFDAVPLPAPTNLSDFASFQACFGGKGVGPPEPCDPLDYDRDNEIDLDDYDIFRMVFTGPK